MNLSTHFSLEEMTTSQWAVRAGIRNDPGELELENLRRLSATLELVRYTLGCPVIVSSAYRCPEVNRHVGGSSTSMHLQGLAADFIAPGFGTPFKVAQKIMATDSIKFDQLIHEYGRWVHLGLTVRGKEPRLQALSIFTGGRYLPGILEKP